MLLDVFRRLVTPLLLVPTLVLSLGACDDNEPADPVCDGEPELLKVTAPDSAAAGGTITMAFEVAHFEFSREGSGHEDGGHEGGGHDGDEDGGHEGAQPSDDNELRAADSTSAETGCFVGHVHVYVDDLMSNPIAQITVESADVVLPDDLAPGEHRLINRLHAASHKIIEPQVILEHVITIE